MAGEWGGFHVVPGPRGLPSIAPGDDPGFFPLPLSCFRGYLEARRPNVSVARLLHALLYMSEGWVGKLLKRWYAREDSNL
jgi:hypothetical protein